MRFRCQRVRRRRTRPEAACSQHRRYKELCCEHQSTECIALMWLDQRQDCLQNNSPQLYAFQLACHFKCSVWTTVRAVCSIWVHYVRMEMSWLVLVQWHFILTIGYIMDDCQNLHREILIANPSRGDRTAFAELYMMYEASRDIL